MNSSFRKWLEGKSITEGAINDLIRKQIMNSVSEYLRSVANNPAIASLNNVEMRLIPMLAMRDADVQKQMLKIARGYSFKDGESKDAVLSKTAEMLERLFDLTEKKFGQGAAERMKAEMEQELSRMETINKKGMPPSARQIKLRAIN